MSNEFSIQAIATVRAGGDAGADLRATASGASEARAEPVAAPSPIINPTLRLNAALGLVVIEFRNDTGAVTTSIPSQRQLAAYQRWETTQFGPTPAGRSRVAAPAPAAPAVEPAVAPPPAKEKDGSVNI